MEKGCTCQLRVAPHRLLHVVRQVRWLSRAGVTPVLALLLAHVLGLKGEPRSDGAARHQVRFSKKKMPVTAAHVGRDFGADPGTVCPLLRPMRTAALAV